MKAFMIIAALVASSMAHAAPAIDPALVGTWKGQRDAQTKCEPLAWTSKFTEDGKFSITFYTNSDRTEEIATETGDWISGNGVSQLKTKGVKTPEIYTYSIIDENRIHYVNKVRDPTADCAEDYEFDEVRAL